MRVKDEEEAMEAEGGAGGRCCGHRREAVGEGSLGDILPVTGRPRCLCGQAGRAGQAWKERGLRRLPWELDGVP